MKLFLIGLPQSGRTTVAKALCEGKKYLHIEYDTWLKYTFRPKDPAEHQQQYNEHYNNYLISRFSVNPDMCCQVVEDTIKSTPHFDIYIIDGLMSPRDFVKLFNINNDMVVFLNRTDSEHECRDSDAVGISVIRDYCFWMASAGYLNKSNWVEYNFKIPGDHSEAIRSLGSKNSVFIVKSISKVISHLSGLLNK